MSVLSEGADFNHGSAEFCHELWRKILTNVQIDNIVSDGNFTMWWRDPSSINLIDIKGDTYIFEVKNFMVKSQFQSKFHNILIKQLKAANPEIADPKLQFNTHKGKPQHVISDDDDVVVIDEPASTK